MRAPPSRVPAMSLTTVVCSYSSAASRRAASTMDNLLSEMVCSCRDIASDIGLCAYPCEETTMPFYERGDVRIHYEEVGSGFPLMIVPGGGLNSTVAGLANHPFNPMEEFKGEYRVIAADLRNANPGQSTGPLENDRPWDAYTDDHLGLMDHLGISEFLVQGFCIGGPFIWNMLKRAPRRVVAGVLAQPSGFRPEIPDLFYQNNIKG